MVGTILLIAITVALAAVVATLVSGLGGRGTPPSAMLTVVAENGPGADEYTLTISHEGGDDLAIDDLEIMATENDTSGEMKTYDFLGAGTFSVGSESTIACDYTMDPSNKVVTVFIIHKPSKQKIFSSSAVVVRE